MNRSLPHGDGRRSRDPVPTFGPGGLVLGFIGLVNRAAVDRREASARAVNVIKHGGFERRTTNPALLKNVAPLETLCATSVRRGDRLGLCS
jgi:hypothetical protein